jgi:adenylate kinase
MKLMEKICLRRGLILGLAGLVLSPGSVLAQQNQQKIVFLMLGPPGVGKTTQAQNLSRKFRIPSYSLATILNKESGWVKNQYKKSLSLPMSTGDFVSDELANQLIEKHITTKKAQNGFILDGYPRSLQQAKYFETTLKNLGLPSPVIIHLTVPDNVAVERLVKRGKKQDKPEIIEARMQDYRAEAKVILEYYKGRVKVVDGVPSQGQVWSAIQKAIQ